jgi:hypothetical protein
LTCSNDFYLLPRRLEEGGKSAHCGDEMYRTCRICSFHFQSWLVYVETLLDGDAHRITSASLSYIYFTVMLPHLHSLCELPLANAHTEPDIDKSELRHASRRGGGGRGVVASLSDIILSCSDRQTN